MIELFSGTPGSGKSLNTARRIRTELLRGKTVIANFPINTTLISKNGKRKIGRFIYLKNDELTTDYLTKHAIENHRAGKEGQSLLVVDEAGIMYNSRDYGNWDRKAWINFFMTHRHYGYNVILVAQIDRLIDKQIRAFIEYDIKHRKANNFKTIGLILSIFRIGTFAAITYWYGQRQRIGGEMFRYRKKDGQLYDTMMLFEGEKHGGSIGAIVSEVLPEDVKSPLPPKQAEKERRKTLLDQWKQKRNQNVMLSNPKLYKFGKLTNPVMAYI